MSPNASELDKIAMADVDIRDGDQVFIVGGGQFITFEQKDGTKRIRLKIEIECAGGYTKELTLNETSRKYLIAGYGKMSEDWVGYPALAQIALQNVGGEMKKIIYLSPIKDAKRR